MNKTEFIGSLATKAEITKKDAELFLSAFISTVEDTLISGDSVKLVGFGNFEVRKRASRKGRNPQTKEEIIIPESKAPVFKAGKSLKELVKNS
jgi:DNA-binding protein HU-beta